MKKIAVLFTLIILCFASNAYAKEVSNIKVDSGYYYRVKGVHSVTHNGVTETTDSVTDPIDYR